MRLVIVDDNCQDQVNGVVTTMNEVKKQLFSRGIYNLIHITPDQMMSMPALVYPGARIPLNFWNLTKRIEAYEPTHLHICTEGVLGLTARQFFQNKNWRYTTSFHTRWDHYLQEKFGVPANKTMRYLKWFHQNSAATLVNTPTMQREMVSLGLSQAITWSRGVDTQLFQFNDRKCSDKPTLLSVGRVSAEKNLEVFCSLSPEKYNLVCVGDGPDLKRLQKTYPWVTFTGQLSGKQLVQQYQNADCFVFTSKSDTFGLVMIESMSVGTPVAAFPVQGPIDVVDDGVTGSLNHDIDAAISQCLTLCRQTVFAGSKKWSWKKTADIFVDTLVPK